MFKRKKTAVEGVRRSRARGLRVGGEELERPL